MFGVAKFAAMMSLCLAAAGCAAPTDSVGAIAPLSVSARNIAPDPPHAGAMPDMGVAEPAPAGFISFCTRFIQQCSTPQDAPAMIALSPETWQALQNVNERINHALRPMDDKRHYGRAEYWNIPTDGYGDCEDYALSKRKALLDAGFSEAALRLAIVLTRSRERHAVLTVTTDHGDFVLDNLGNAITGWDQTGYQWLERQDARQAWLWTAYDADRADAASIASIADPVGAAR